jgi:chromosome segregation ATPase
LLSEQFAALSMRASELEREDSGLSDTIKAKEAECSALRDQVSTFHQQLLQYQEGVAQQTRFIEALQAERDTHVGALQSLQASHEQELYREREELNDQVQSLKNIIRELQQSESLLRDQEQSLQTELRELRDSSAVRERELHSSVDTLSSKLSLMEEASQNRMNDCASEVSFWLLLLYYMI